MCKQCVNSVNATSRQVEFEAFRVLSFAEVVKDGKEVSKIKDIGAFSNTATEHFGNLWKTMLIKNHRKYHHEFLQNLQNLQATPEKATYFGDLSEIWWSWMDLEYSEPKVQLSSDIIYPYLSTRRVDICHICP